MPAIIKYEDGSVVSIDDNPGSDPTPIEVEPAQEQQEEDNG